MTENEAKSPNPPFLAPASLWLVPWAVFLFVVDVWLFKFFCPPLPNPCLPFLGTVAEICKLLLWLSIPALVFIGLAFGSRALRRRALHLPWQVLGVLGLALAILVLLVVHASYKYIDESAGCRALGDCRNISTAMLLFHKDTGEWPYYCSPFDDADRVPCLDYLYGNMGDMPDLYEPAWETWGTVIEDMFFSLVKNGRDEPWYRPATAPGRKGSGPPGVGWREPYLPYVTDDPWARKYLVSVGCFEGGRRDDCYVWCISAGPNACVETPTWSTETFGDDIGYRMTSQVHN